LRDSLHVGGTVTVIADQLHGTKWSSNRILQMGVMVEVYGPWVRLAGLQYGEVRMCFVKTSDVRVDGMLAVLGLEIAMALYAPGI
jgi:hypothetical protein